LREKDHSTLLLLLVITFVQDVCIYIAETNHVSALYSFAAILYLRFMLHPMLFPMLNGLYVYISGSSSMYYYYYYSDQYVIFCGYTNLNF
jgi:hypothetical protein